MQTLTYSPILNMRVIDVKKTKSMRDKASIKRSIGNIYRRLTLPHSMVGVLAAFGVTLISGTMI